MKKIIICIGVVGAMLFQSCIDKFLDQKPYSSSSPETFYKTERDFNQALAGCYASINTSSVGAAAGQSSTTVSMGTYNAGLFYILEGCSDVVVSQTGSGSHFDALRASYQTNQSEIRQFWIAYFNGISRCNYLLENLKKDNDVSPEKKIFLEGETRFLRAFFYLHLAQTFGGVPVYEAPAAGSVAPRDNLQKVYGLIISDLEFAYKNLGDVGTYHSSTNKWAAGAYLGATYNYLASVKRFKVGASLVKLNPLNSFAWVDENQMSTNAKDVLADVVLHSPYKLVEAANYKKLFYEMSKSVQSEEVLFASESSDETSQAIPVNTMYFCPTGDTNNYGGSWQRGLPTMKLYNLYSDNDNRRDMFITGAINPNGKYNDIPTGVPYEMVDNIKYYLPEKSSGSASGKSYTLWSPGKFRMADPSIKSNHARTQLNYPLMRMADVMLQYAEALYFTGDESEARIQFTSLRERIVTSPATVTTLNSTYYKPDFVEELLDERARELCFESKRRIDIMRFGKITEYIIDLDPSVGTNNLGIGINTLKDNWREYKMWLPIPQLEIDINRNLEQNAIYVD